MGKSLFPTDYYDTFDAFLTGIGKKYLQKPAITTYNREGEPITRSYGVLVQDACSFGKALNEKGYRGKHIAIAAENSYEWMVAFLGILSIGSIAVLIDIEQSTETICQMICAADADAVVVSGMIAELLRPQKKMQEMPLIVFDSKASYDCNFYAVCEDGKRLLEKEKETKIGGKGEQTGIIAFTSGTTSTAKPVMLSQKGILCNASGAVSLVQPTTKVFTSLPLFHTYGLTCAVLGPLISGAHICINGDLKTMLRDMKRFDAQTVMAVPLITEMLYKMLVVAAQQSGLQEEVIRKQKRLPWLGGQVDNPVAELVSVKEKNLGSLSIIVCGGAHLSHHISEALARFGILVLQGYGITECSPLISVNRKDNNNPKSVGQLLPEFEVRFLEDEILVRGESVMQGYYKEEKLTQEAFYEGWFRTGDLGRIDKKGFLYLDGRIKNLIVLKNGKKIAPEEIEERLSVLPMVKEVLAYGATTGRSADDVQLAVIIYPDQKETEGMSAYEILNTLQKEIDKINLQYPSYKQIQMVNLRENEFIKTSSNKIKRQIV